MPAVRWGMSSSSDNSVAALEVSAQQAGAALACLYSSSDEYDAALIAERRAAGVYGPRRQRRQMLIASAGVAVGVAVIILVLQIL